MEIFEVAYALKNDDPARPLELRSLDFLDPKREPYLAMLLQPRGRVVATTDRVGNADQAAAADMCRKLLEYAAIKQADLVVAPEYCVPWVVVDDIIDGKLLPRSGAIWALGCESITPGELRALSKKVTDAKAQVRLIHEPIDARQEGQKRYIDPLLYAFWTKDQDQKEILCLLVQFKTAPCKDEGHVELTALYLGRIVYVFNRHINCISLLGIICSDAFEFTDELVEQNHRNSLILHLQLNPKPSHTDYARYRNRLFSVATESHAEVLCLNWAGDVLDRQQDGTYKCWNNIAGSAWYLPPPKFDAKDDVVDALHRLGIYRNVVLPKRWHAFYFNYAPQAFLLRKQKVFNNGPQALVQPVGVEVAEVLHWDAGSWSAYTPNDGFSNVLEDYENLQVDLPKLCMTSPLSVERVLELLVGPKGSANNWYRVDELDALQVDADESIKQVTVHQEKDNNRSGVKFRHSRLSSAQSAVTLAGQPVPWPPPASDLQNGCRFRWEPDDPHRNVVSLNGPGEPATLMYLGENPPPGAVEAHYKKLEQALTVHAVTQGADIYAANRCKDRLCVVFKRNHNFQVHRPEGLTSITRPAGTSPVDVAGENG